MLITGLVAYLLAQTSITSLIAQGNAIQPIPAPVETTDSNGNALYPCITYQMVSDVPEYTLTGTAGISTARIVFDCLAPLDPGGYGVARNIALAVKAALAGYTGTLPDGTVVWRAESVNVVDLFSPDALFSHTAVHVLVIYED
jgi:hypothetical protein